MTNLESAEFNQLYCELSSKDKDIFKDITIRLLKVNFLLRRINSEMYLFILSHKDMFILFFQYINFDFIVREDKELAYIKSNDEKLSKNLTKNETICLLVLRLLYQRKIDEVSLSNDIEITVKELQDQLFAVGFDSNNDRVKKSILNDMLRTFKQHNIVYYNDQDTNLDNTIITIYPSIEVAMDFKEMEQILIRLESLSNGEEADLDA